MRLALALYASTAHANTPHYDLDLLYHDGSAHRVDKRLLIWLCPSRLRRLMPGGPDVFVIGLWTFLRALSLGSAGIALENVALRHQLLVLQRSVGRSRLSRWDRILWVWLSRLWMRWRSSLIMVQPATVLAWHRQGFRLYWHWRSTANRVGRPRLGAEIRPADPPHGARESDVGPAADPGGARPPRLRGRLSTLISNTRCLVLVERFRPTDPVTAVLSRSGALEWLPDRGIMA